MARWLERKICRQRTVRPLTRLVTAEVAKIAGAGEIEMTGRGIGHRAGLLQRMRSCRRHLSQDWSITQREGRNMTYRGAAIVGGAILSVSPAARPPLRRPASAITAAPMARSSSRPLQRLLTRQLQLDGQGGDADKAAVAHGHALFGRWRHLEVTRAGLARLRHGKRPATACDPA